MVEILSFIVIRSHYCCLPGVNAFLRENWVVRQGLPLTIFGGVFLLIMLCCFPRLELSQNGSNIRFCSRYYSFSPPGVLLSSSSWCL